MLLVVLTVEQVQVKYRGQSHQTASNEDTDGSGIKEYDEYAESNSV